MTEATFLCYLRKPIIGKGVIVFFSPYSEIKSCIFLFLCCNSFINSNGNEVNGFRYTRIAREGLISFTHSLEATLPRSLKKWIVSWIVLKESGWSQTIQQEGQVQLDDESNNGWEFGYSSEVSRSGVVESRCSSDVLLVVAGCIEANQSRLCILESPVKLLMSSHDWDAPIGFDWYWWSHLWFRVIVFKWRGWGRQWLVWREGIGMRLRD